MYYKNTVESISIPGEVYVWLWVGIVGSNLVRWCGVKKKLDDVQILHNYDSHPKHTAYPKFSQYHWNKILYHLDALSWKSPS